MSKSIKLNVPNQEDLELPVLEASIGHDVVDIRALTKNTGLFSFDPGFVSTASCESKITYIDGDKGLLYYRGYPIEQLAEKSDYLEVCYLLIYGELPTPEQKAEFDNTVRRHTMVHEQLTWFFRGFDGDDGRRGRCIVCVLSRQPGHHEPRTPQNRDLPSDFQNSDDCGNVLPLFQRSAVQLSKKQPLLFRKLHAHDVRYTM